MVEIVLLENLKPLNSRIIFKYAMLYLVKYITVNIINIDKFNDSR